MHVLRDGPPLIRVPEEVGIRCTGSARGLVARETEAPATTWSWRSTEGTANIVETIAAVAAYFIELDSLLDSPCVPFFMFSMLNGENQRARKAIPTSNQFMIITPSNRAKVPREHVERDNQTRGGLGKVE